MSHPYPGLVAGADISPCRFVKGGSAGFTVIQSVAGNPSLGISREFVYDAPTDGASGLAASAGKPIQIARLGQVCEVEVGAAVLAWAYLKPDANGRAVTAASADQYSAIALDAQATSGNRVLVEVIRGITP